MRTLVPISLVCLVAVVSSATVAHYSFPSHYGRYAQASATVISHPWDNINSYYNILQSTPSQEVCGVLNGVFKTFHCMDDLLAQVLNGHGMTFSGMTLEE